MEIKALIRPDLLDLIPYSSARDEFTGDINDLVMLDANENNFSTSFNRYPSSNQMDLRNALAKELGINASQLIFGNGSDEMIDLIIRLFAVPFQDSMIVCEPTYGMYRVAAKLNGVAIDDIPLNESFEPNIDAIANSTAKLLWICNPNNPTGNVLDQSQIVSILRAFKGIVVVDEAYIDFCASFSSVNLVEEFPNLIVLQTFSKAKGLAGLRLGYAVANTETIAWLAAIKPPYNVNSYTLQYALDCVGNNEWNNWVTQINQEKQRVLNQLLNTKGVIKIYRSATNFILFKVEKANEVYEFLTEKGVVIRNRNKQINNALRVTIGTEIENDLFLKYLQECLSK